LRGFVIEFKKLPGAWFTPISSGVPHFPTFR
jgi:hypothetical protein